MIFIIWCYFIIITWLWLCVCHFLQEEYTQKTGLTSAPLSFTDEQKQEVYYHLLFDQHVMIILLSLRLLFVFIFLSVEFALAVYHYVYKGDFCCIVMHTLRRWFSYLVPLIWRWNWLGFQCETAGPILRLVTCLWAPCWFSLVVQL